MKKWAFQWLVVMFAGLLLIKQGVAEELSLDATSAVIAGTFALTNGYLCQFGKAGMLPAGRATFDFHLTKAGSYAIQATVNLKGTATNCFLVNIDANPTQQAMTWDIAPTSGFEPRLVSWRGNGTATLPEFRTKIFNLEAGSHQLIVQGADTATQLQRVVILPLPEAPTGLHVVAKP